MQSFIKSNRCKYRRTVPIRYMYIVHPCLLYTSQFLNLVLVVGESNRSVPSKIFGYDVCRIDRQIHTRILSFACVDNHTSITGRVRQFGTEKQGTPVEVAIMYNTSYNENVHSYVNNINTIEGGTHLAGFMLLAFSGCIALAS